MEYIIEYVGITPGAAESAQCACQFTLQPGSDCKDVIAGALPFPPASLERNSYNPRTPRKFAPDSGIGLASALQSGASGELPSPFVIEFQFAHYYTFTGFTINAKTALKDFTVEAFRDEASAGRGDFSAQSEEYFAKLTAQTVNKVRITVRALQKPFHFLHIYSIVFGRVEKWDENTIVSALMEDNISLSALESPLSVLDLSLRITEPQRLFQTNQPVKISSVDGELKRTFYIEKGIQAKDDDSEIKLKCYCALSALDGVQSMGGIWTSPTSASNVLSHILDGTGAGCGIDASLEDVMLTGYVPICSVREALRAVSLAVNGILRCDNETPFICPASFITDTAPGAQYGKGEIVSFDAKETSKQPIESLNFTQHSYSKGDEEKEEYSWYLSKNEETMITFSEPLHSLKAYEITGENNEKTLLPEGSVTFVKSDANYCRVINTAGITGRISITGQKYVDSKAVTTIANPYADANVVYSAVNIENVTLAGNTEQIKQRLFDYHSRANNLTAQVINGGEALMTDMRVELLGSNYDVQKITTALDGLSTMEVI